MRHRILLMSSIPHLVRTKHDAVLGLKAAAAPLRAASTSYVSAVDIGAQVVDFVAHEADYGTCFHHFLAFGLFWEGEEGGEDCIGGDNRDFFRTARSRRARCGHRCLCGIERSRNR